MEEMRIDDANLYEAIKKIKNAAIAGMDCQWIGSGSDAVDHPAHYNLPGLPCESIDVIKSVLGTAGFRSFCRGNALKYLIRADRKGGAEDLKKAMVYLRWETAAGEDLQ